MHTNASTAVGAGGTGKRSQRHQQSARSQQSATALAVRAMPASTVDHVTVGRYRFPLYSHPLFRIRLAEDAYVEQRVQSCLDDPGLYGAMNDLVESLLAQGRDGASMEDIQKLMEAQLGSLDTYWLRSVDGNDSQMAMDTAPATATTPGALPKLVSTSGHTAWSSPVTRGLAVPGPALDGAGGGYEAADKATVRQGQYQSSTHDALVPSTHALSPAATRGPGDVNGFVSSVDTSEVRAASQTRNYFTLPTVSPAVVPMQAYVGLAEPSSPLDSATATRGEARRRGPQPGVCADDNPLLDRGSIDSHRAGRGTSRLDRSAAHGLPVIVPITSTANNTTNTNKTAAAATATTTRSANLSGTLPHWHGACRDAVYSLLHIRLQEDVANGRGAHEQQTREAAMLRDIATARERQRAVDSTTLAAMAPSTYAALDVTLDGNSTCLSRRTQAGHADERVKIMSSSRALCAQRSQKQHGPSQPTYGLAPSAQARHVGNLRTHPAATTSITNAKASSQSMKARRVAAQHQRMVAQEQARRENEAEQELRRREGLDGAASWW